MTESQDKSEEAPQHETHTPAAPDPQIHEPQEQVRDQGIDLLAIRAQAFAQLMNDPEFEPLRITDFDEYAMEAFTQSRHSPKHTEPTLVIRPLRKMIHACSGIIFLLWLLTALAFATIGNDYFVVGFFVMLTLYMVAATVATSFKSMNREIELYPLGAYIKHLHDRDEPSFYFWQEAVTANYRFGRVSIGMKEGRLSVWPVLPHVYQTIVQERELRLMQIQERFEKDYQMITMDSDFFAQRQVDHNAEQEALTPEENARLLRYHQFQETMNAPDFEIMKIDYLDDIASFVFFNESIHGPEHATPLHIVGPVQALFKYTAITLFITWIVASGLFFVIESNAPFITFYVLLTLAMFGLGYMNATKLVNRFVKIFPFGVYCAHRDGNDEPVYFFWHPCVEIKYQFGTLSIFEAGRKGFRFWPVMPHVYQLLVGYREARLMELKEIFGDEPIPHIIEDAERQVAKKAEEDKHNDENQ